MSQVPPKVSVSRRDAPDGSITLSCYTRGSYPRPIHISWMRDGKDILVEKESSGILPNADGTYYMQSSLEISLQEEDRHCYACRVEHSSLAEPALVWAPGKKGSLPLWVLASIALAALVLAGAVGASVTLWRRKSAAACVSRITGSPPSQRLVKIRRRKKHTHDEMFSELMLSSHTDRAQTNA
ncbi:unnamed protein product [Caretta caretta]